MATVGRTPCFTWKDADSPAPAVKNAPLRERFWCRRKGWKAGRILPGNCSRVRTHYQELFSCEITCEKAKYLHSYTVGATEDRDKGLFNLTIDNDISNVTDLKFETTISTDSILDVLDMLNYLAMVDYYVEAVSGTVQAGAFSQAALAGTVALLLTENDVRADVGKNAALTLGENEDAESLRVENAVSLTPSMRLFS